MSGDQGGAVNRKVNRGMGYVMRYVMDYVMGCSTKCAVPHALPGSAEHPAPALRAGISKRGRRAWATMAAGLVSTSLLAGCASTRMIDSEVRSFVGTSAPAAEASYQFERLPSQQGSDLQDALESAAANALKKVGLRSVATGSNSNGNAGSNVSANNASTNTGTGATAAAAPQAGPQAALQVVPPTASPAARYGAQVSLQVTQFPNPNQPRPRSGLFMGIEEPRRMGAAGMLLIVEPPWYRHTVQIVLRERASGQVVYETSASFDGPWSDTRNLLPALLEAALQGYPQASPTPRKVTIELPPPAP